MDAIIIFLQDMPFWYWLVFALLLLAIEMATGSTYFFWPAIAAFAAGLLALLPFSSWQMELIAFAAVTIALSFYAPSKVKPWLHDSQTDHFNLNERGAQKIGRRAIVEDDFSDGSGKVRLGDTLWLAESENGENISAGQSVTIVRAEGTKLVVGPPSA